MTETSERRLGELARRIADDSIDLAVVTETDSIFLSGQPVGLSGPREQAADDPGGAEAGEPTLICPAIEVEMARQMTSVSDIRSWVDGVNGEWPALLETVLAAHRPRSVGPSWPACRDWSRTPSGRHGRTRRSSTSPALSARCA